MRQAGHYIQAWRKHRQLTQQQVADRIDMDKSTVSRIETGKVEYSQSTLEAFAFALNCSPADLLSPPPAPGSPQNELSEYVLSLNKDAQQKALRILRAAMTEGDAEVA